MDRCSFCRHTATLFPFSAATERKAIVAAREREPHCVNGQEPADVSRIEEGRIEVNYDWETPDEMVYSTLSRFEELAAKKNLSLVFRSAIEGREVLTDKHILMEIPENLISNDLMTY